MATSAVTERGSGVPCAVGKWAKPGNDGRGGTTKAFSLCSPHCCCSRGARSDGKAGPHGAQGRYYSTGMAPGVGGPTRAAWGPSGRAGTLTPGCATVCGVPAACQDWPKSADTGRYCDLERDVLHVL